MEKKVNRCMYSLKGIACIGVVIMHCGFPTTIGDLIRYAFKFAVPVFFMISGYFTYSTDKHIVEKKILKHIKHCIWLLIWSEVFYGCVSLIFNFMEGEMTIISWIQSIGITDLKKILGILWHGSFFNGTFWFLYAIIWGYVFLYFINKYKIYGPAYVYAVVMLMLHVIIRTLWRICQWPGYDAGIFRNAFVYGLPFMLLGCGIRQMENSGKLSVKSTALFWIFIAGNLLTVIEYLLTRQALDIFLGTVVSSCAMFVFAVLNPQFYGIAIIEWIGKRLSMIIYVIHIFCIDVIEKIYIRIGVNENVLFAWLKPIIAILFSIVSALVYDYAKQKVLLYKNNKKLEV